MNNNTQCAVKYVVYQVNSPNRLEEIADFDTRQEAEELYEEMRKAFPDRLYTVEVE